MDILFLPNIGAQEGSLKCETIEDVVFSPDHNSSSRFFVFLDVKITVIDGEGRMSLGVDKGEQLLSIFVRRFVKASIHEKVLFSGVAMDIYEEEDWSALDCFIEHLFGIEYFRE